MMIEALAVLLITEIMYDPASNERWPAKTEWVEVYNPHDHPVDLEGWHLHNERGRTVGIGEGVTIKPGEAIVLIPGNQTVENFREAWGEGFQVVPLRGWHRPGLHQLSNNPSEEVAILSLRRPDESISDTVNYDNEEPWPSNKPDGPSIYRLPDRLDVKYSSDGTSWRRSQADVHGGRHAKETSDYSAKDVGSPGRVVTAEEAKQDEPTAAEAAPEAESQTEAAPQGAS